MVILNKQLGEFENIVDDVLGKKEIGKEFFRLGFGMLGIMATKENKKICAYNYFGKFLILLNHK